MLSVLRLAPPLRVPPLSEVSLKVSYISHSAKIRELVNAADDSILYVRPDVSQFKLLDYHLLDKIVVAGATATELVLDKASGRARRRARHATRVATLRALRSQATALQLLSSPAHSAKEGPVATDSSSSSQTTQESACVIPSDSAARCNSGQPLEGGESSAGAEVKKQAVDSPLSSTARIGRRDDQTVAMVEHASHVVNESSATDSEGVFTIGDEHDGTSGQA